jgi:hypothetical protein
VAAALAALLLLAACGDAGGDTTLAPTTVTAAPATGPIVRPTNAIISRGGLGDAVGGLTAPELAALLGPVFEMRPTNTVLTGTEGVTFLLDGTVQFHALHLVHEGPALDLLVTENPGYRTAAGIGPGSTLDDAVAAYGSPRLSFSVLDDGREFVQFDGGPPANVVFRVVGPDGDLAGDYPEPQQDFNQTEEVRPGSTIAAVWVFHDPEDEPGDEVVVEIGEYAVDVDAGSSLNIRSGPGIEFAVVDEFFPGTQDARTTGRGAIGEDGDEWWEVELPTEGGTGWVRASFLLSGAGATQPSVAVTPIEACVRLFESWGAGDLAAASRVATEDVAAELFAHPFSPPGGSGIGGSGRDCFYDNGTEFAEVAIEFVEGTARAVAITWYPAEVFLGDNLLLNRFNAGSGGNSAGGTDG